MRCGLGRGGGGWRRLWRCARLLAATWLCVLLLSPLRNAVLWPVLPVAWRAYPSVTLARMLVDTQRLPVPTTLLHGHRAATPTLTVNLSHVQLFREADDPFAHFHRQRALLAARAERDPEARERLALVDRFTPGMTAEERTQLRFTMHVFVKACRAHDLDFYLIEGSLLGAYRHHGLVPWDDDVDLALNVTQWRQFMHVLGSIPGFSLYVLGNTQWKFFLSSLPPLRGSPFKYPAIDLWFIRGQDSLAWSLTWGLKPHFMLDLDRLVPPSWVTWEGMTLPAPACVERLLVENYDGAKRCVTPEYVHKTDAAYNTFQQDKVDCSLLHDFYPFVFRYPTPDGRGVVESRRLGGRLLGNVTVPAAPESCSR